MSDFKSQLMQDVRDTFMNLSEFADLLDIRYFNNGTGKPPIIRSIPGILSEDVCHKRKRGYYGRESLGNDQAIYPASATLTCALADFSPMPKVGRSMQINGAEYRVQSVQEDMGMLEVKLSRLTE